MAMPTRRKNILGYNKAYTILKKKTFFKTTKMVWKKITPPPKNNKQKTAATLIKCGKLIIYLVDVRR